MFERTNLFFYEYNVSMLVNIDNFVRENLHNTKFGKM